MSEKLRFIVGDKVKFVLIKVAKFTKGNYFTGEIYGINAKEFSVRIKPSVAAAKKLADLLDKRGTLDIEFKCVQFLSVERALAYREELKVKAEENQLAKLKAAYLKERSKKPKKVKKPAKWNWQPGK